MCATLKSISQTPGATHETPSSDQPPPKPQNCCCLGCCARARNKAFPDVPTVMESGWDTITESPFGFGGPKGMDPALVKVLESAFAKVNQDPKVLEVYDKFFQPVIWMDSAEYSRYAARTFAQERATIERLGLLPKG
jgi:tripartite-type tricarboxylate transporter receptor subunit TctC